MLTEAAPQAQTDEIEVAIIGCGPVGAMLANLLGLQGISTLVLEREAAIYHLPRAVHFDDEVMRLLQTVGLAEAMQPLVHVSPGMKFVGDDGRLLLDWPRPQERGPQAWHASYRFHQPELERVLRDGLSRFPSVVGPLSDRGLRHRSGVGRRGGPLRGPRDAAVSRNAGRATSWAATGLARWCGA